MTFKYFVINESFQGFKLVEFKLLKYFNFQDNNLGMKCKCSFERHKIRL